MSQATNEGSGLFSVDRQQRELREAATDRGSIATQRAVMSESATLDAAPPFGVELVKPVQPGQPNGLAAAPVER